MRLMTEAGEMEQELWIDALDGVSLQGTLFEPRPGAVTAMGSLGTLPGLVPLSRARRSRYLRQVQSLGARARCG